MSDNTGSNKTQKGFGVEACDVHSWVTLRDFGEGYIPNTDPYPDPDSEDDLAFFYGSYYQGDDYYKKKKTEEPECTCGGNSTEEKMHARYCKCFNKDKFESDSEGSEDKKAEPCTCDLEDLIANGCKCGAIESDRRRAKKKDCGCDDDCTNDCGNCNG